MLQWVLEQAIPRRSTDVDIAERIMLVNFAAIHTSSNVRLSPACSEPPVVLIWISECDLRSISSGGTPRVDEYAAGGDRGNCGRRRLEEGFARQDVEARQHFARVSTLQRDKWRYVEK